MSERDDVFTELLLEHKQKTGHDEDHKLQIKLHWKQKWHAAVRADNLAEYQRRLEGRPHAEAEPVRQRPSVHEIAMHIVAQCHDPGQETCEWIYKIAQSLYDAGTEWEQRRQENSTT